MTLYRTPQFSPVTPQNPLLSPVPPVFHPPDLGHHLPLTHSNNHDNNDNKDNDNKDYDNEDNDNDNPCFPPT